MLAQMEPKYLNLFNSKERDIQFWKWTIAPVSNIFKKKNRHLILDNREDLKLEHRSIIRLKPKEAILSQEKKEKEKPINSYT